MTARIYGFHGPDAEFLSNFYTSPFEAQGLQFATVEHYFQAMKTTHPAERKAIAATAAPGQAKRLGRSVELRPDWDAIRISVMRQALRFKFPLPPEGSPFDPWSNAPPGTLSLQLANTALRDANLALYEHNTWGDEFWGVTGPYPGVGQNWLGHLLMARRAEVIGVLSVPPF